MSTQHVVVSIFLLGTLSGSARAEPESKAPIAHSSNQATTGRDWHVGVNFRTDFGAHYYRADVGVRLARLDLLVVLDPLGLKRDDYDFDAIARYAGDRWSLWGGARVSTVPVGRDRVWTEKLLVGVSAELPRIVSDDIRIHSGLELAIHVRSHGGDVMTRWVCVDSPDCREDHFVFGLFGRVEYASAF